MKNRYKQDKAASAEILRLILQKTAGHPASFTPPTYAVWYEFLTGINPPLSEAMNNLLNENEQITNEIAQELYNLYISESNPETQKAFRLNMQRVLGNLAQFAETTGGETGRFSAGLQKYGEKLTSKLDPSMLQNLVGEIMQDTQNMRSSVDALQGKLHESKSEIEKLQQELQNARSEALIDPMTGVLNRRGFELQIKKLSVSADLQGKKIAFLMLDIDFFKKVNDTYGHLFGDKVIRTIAEMLKAKVKGQDSVARLGGEEFAVLLPDTSLQGAYAVAEHIRQGIEKGKIRRQDKQENVEGITISIGIADCDAHGDWMDAMSKADKALYASKKQGRNRTTLYSS
jgi:diguanylate cyclase